MLNTNYAKLVGEYPEYLRLPVELQSPLIINGVTHPAGAHLSTNDDAAIKELGYKPVTRTAMPTREGYYYTESWTETETAIVQECSHMASGNLIRNMNSMPCSPIRAT